MESRVAIVGVYKPKYIIFGRVVNDFVMEVEEM